MPASDLTSSNTLIPDTDVAARARAWRTAVLSTSCDLVETWDHGCIFRATAYPSCYDLNVVRVEGAAPLGVDELIAVADEALEGLDHRLVEFGHAEAADPLRGEFERRGWRALRLVWMRHAGGLPPATAIPVCEVPFDAVGDLRVRWHSEDFPGSDPTGFHVQAREAALRRGARVLAALRGEVPVAFAQLEHLGRDAEVSEVYVSRDHRGAGLGAAVTRAAVAAADGVRDLWISADNEDRPKRLYHRLGFRAAAHTMQFLRLPV